MSLTRTKGDNILQCILQYCAAENTKTAAPLNIPPPQFLIYRLFSSCPPFPCRLRKPPQSSSSQALPPSRAPPKNESITHTIVTAMKKHSSPFIAALPQHAPQKLPKSPRFCPNTSKQALTTSPVKHLLPFSSMLYVSFQAPYLRAAKT